MLTVYHKNFRSTCILSATATNFPWLERVVLNALEKRFSRLKSERLATRLPSSCGQDDPPQFQNFFLFISHFPSVEDGPGGIYLSGKSPNPANRRHLRIDPSARVG
jgi:hypothetical protein